MMSPRVVNGMYEVDVCSTTGRELQEQLKEIQRGELGCPTEI